MAEFGQLRPVRLVVVFKVEATTEFLVQMRPGHELGQNGVETDLSVSSREEEIGAVERHTLSRVIGSIKGEIPAKNAFIHHLRVSSHPRVSKISVVIRRTAC